MAKKRINQLTQTATGADVVAGNFLALDTEGGTKKMPVDLLATEEHVEQVAESVPTKTSDIINDGNGTEQGSQFVESSAVTSIVRVTAMPESPTPGTLYLVVEG